MPMQCEIVTQERTVFSREVDAINLPGKGGRMGVLPNHMVMLAALDFGEVIVRYEGEEEFFAVGGGFAEILPDRVTILADSAEHAEEIDVQRAQQAREEAEQAMREGVPEDAERFAQIEAALKRAQLRIEVGRRRSTGRRRRTMPAGPSGPRAREQEEPGEEVE